MARDILDAVREDVGLFQQVLRNPAQKRIKTERSVYVHMCILLLYFLRRCRSASPTRWRLWDTQKIELY